jgi:hypothetical protein
MRTIRFIPLVGVGVLGFAAALACGSSTSDDVAAGDAGACSASCNSVACNGPPNCSSKFPELKLECTKPAICPRARFIEISEPDGGPRRVEATGSDDEANARCALEALRDGRIGSVSFTVVVGSVGPDPGEVFDNDIHGIIHIVDGRRAFAETGTPPLQGNDGWTVNVDMNVPLEPQSFFSDCLVKNDAEVFANCLRNAIDRRCP